MAEIKEKSINIQYLDLYAKMPKFERRKFLALNDCIYFGETYIKPFAEGWDSKTSIFHYEMIEALEKYEFLQIHIPYDHAKTTWISIVYPLWLLAKNTSTQILLISSTPKLVQKCLAVISWHLLENKMLLKDFHYLKPDKSMDKWTDTQIYLERKSVSKDPSVEAVGMGGAILGGKYHRIIGDDVCDRNNMNTEHLRDGAENWWLEDVHSRLTPNGHIANIGTLQHPDDLGVRLSKNVKYHYIHKSAIINEDTQEVLWKERYSYERLVKIKETIGTIRFERTYQNNIKSFTGILLHPEWLHYYKDYEIDITKLKVFFGVDPDIADENINAEDIIKHCWFVIAVLGWHEALNLIYVLQIYYGVHSFPQQVKILMDYANRWNPFKIAIEQNMYQKALKQQTFLVGLPVVGVTSSQNKNLRIESRNVDYEIGRILIMENQLELVNEWIHFGDGKYKNDILDAIDIGCRIIPIRKKEYVLGASIEG